MTRSLGKIVLRMFATAVEIFFFLCSKLDESTFPLITRPVKPGLYSLHSNIDFTKTMHWIKNWSEDTAESRFVIIFKLKSIDGARTVWSPNEYGCLDWRTTKVFINLVHVLFVKSHNRTNLSWKVESASKNYIIRNKMKRYSILQPL